MTQSARGWSSVRACMAKKTARPIWPRRMIQPMLPQKKLSFLAEPPVRVAPDQ